MSGVGGQKGRRREMRGKMSGEPGTSGGEFDVVVVGAGFAGMYMLHRLRQRGLSVRVIEAGDGVGGTWYWNRYPGARCDVESIDYCYSFAPELLEEWRWRSRYPTQPEILEYANHVADRFDLRRDIQFSSRVTGARYDEGGQLWELEIDGGDRLRARFCVMATGCLSAARTPPIPGVETFRGSIYHTGQWPHEPVDFAGQRVGVIGTGSSGIQSIPVIAEAAAHVFVFQRTPNFSLPANDRPLDEELVARVEGDYLAYKDRARRSRAGVPLPPPERGALDVDEVARREVYEDRWERGGVAFMTAFNDLMVDEDANRTAAEFVRAKIREIVDDGDLAERLAPRDHPVGSKRICIDSDYYATYNRDNVTLVDIRETPIVALTPTAVETAGASYELDSVVFATGFDAMTGALLAIDPRGRGGRALSEKWAGGPRTYLGLMTAGFPNLFFVTGPGSPSVLSNMIVSIEQHVEWIDDCIAHLREHDLATIEATVEAEDAWVQHVNSVASRTLYMQANSWYLGANIPGKPRVFMPYVGGVGPYREICERVVANEYEGFLLSSGPVDVQEAHTEADIGADVVAVGADQYVSPPVAP